MRMPLPLTLLFSLLILFSAPAHSQKTENNFNIDLGVGFNPGDMDEDGDGEGMLFIKFGHEWKLFPFLGIELKTSIGLFNYRKHWQEFDSNKQLAYENYNRKSINCSYQTISTNINGYLNLFYDEQDNPDLYLFARVPLGIAAIQSEGKLLTFEDEKLYASSKYTPHFFTGLEIGIGGMISNSFLVKASIGGSTIKFDDAIDALDKGNVDFPLDFESIVTEPAIKLGLTYVFKYQKK